MLERGNGDMLRSGTQALVSPVNCVGVMGKCLALEFRNKFPDVHATYRKVCGRGEVRPGRMSAYRPGCLKNRDTGGTAAAQQFPLEFFRSLSGVCGTSVKWA